MKLGLIGLGRMGQGLAERARRGGHEMVGYDRQPGRVADHLNRRHDLEARFGAAHRLGNGAGW